MSAITVRGLTEKTHAGLRRLAASRGCSVESLVRETLANLAAGEEMVTNTPAAGLSEQAMAWPMPAPTSAGTFEALWGALAGRIHLAEGADLTAPSGEAWDAEAGDGAAGDAEAGDAEAGCI
jgi:plasmid stability protein